VSRVFGDPKARIITVDRNSAATIEETIRSVVSQNYPHIEHIVMDGASTNVSVDIVRRDSEKIAIFSSEQDRGIYDAMNKRLAMATGDIIGFLNADDVYADSRLFQ